MDNQNNKNPSSLPPITPDNSQGPFSPPPINAPVNTAQPSTGPLDNNVNTEPVMPQIKNAPRNEFITPSSVTTGTKSSGGFGKFVIAGIVIIVLIYGVVGYLYYQNQKMKSPQVSENTGTDTASNAEAQSPEKTFLPENIKIENGNVVYLDPAGGTQNIVDKASYTSTGITGFAKVAVSPDGQKLCFESWPPAPEPALFISNINGTEVTEVNPNRRYCVWTADSKKLIYENTAVSATDILIYDDELKTENNLTPETLDSDFAKSFSLVGLSADNMKVICNYESTISEDNNGQCEIDIASGEVTYK